MAEEKSIWVGKDEHNGVRAQPRKDLKPPPHWRLEAVAATRRPRSLTVGADRRRAVFIEDGDTSDVWLLDLDGSAPPERLTTGRDPMPFWEDAEPRLSPDGATVAYVDGEHVCLVPVAGGPPRRLIKASSPVWVDDDTPGRLGRARRHDSARRRGHGRRLAAPARHRPRRPRRARGRGPGRRLAGRPRGRVHVLAARRPQPQRDPGGSARRRRGSRPHRHAAHARRRRRPGRPTARRSPTPPSAAASTSSTWSEPTARTTAS